MQLPLLRKSPAPHSPDTGQIAASQYWVLSRTLVRPSVLFIHWLSIVPLEKEGGRTMSCPISCLCSPHPFPPLSLGPAACPFSHALLQDPSQVPDSLSSTRTPVLSGSAAGCYHCPLWPARMDAGRRLWGLTSWCQVYGAKACKGLGTTLLPRPVLGAGS